MVAKGGHIAIMFLGPSLLREKQSKIHRNEWDGVVSSTLTKYNIINGQDLATILVMIYRAQKHNSYVATFWIRYSKLRIQWSLGHRGACTHEWRPPKGQYVSMYTMATDSSHVFVLWVPGFSSWLIFMIHDFYDGRSKGVSPCTYPPPPPTDQNVLNFMRFFFVNI